MAYLDRAGVRIHYRVTGPLDGNYSGSNYSVGNYSVGNIPVLLSHGFGACAAMWEPNLPALAAARQVITWDMRGHGRSGAPDDPGEYTHAACVADMAALLDCCGISRAVVGGLSLGGYLSLAFYLAHPERVAALMLFDTGPGFRNDQARQEWNDRAIATAGRLERDGLSASQAPLHDSASGLAHAARGMLTQRDAVVLEALPSITVPVLVLVGALDRAFLGAADYVTAKIAGARRCVIPDAGHTANLDAPEAFDDVVLGFLADLAVR
jgi:pimeloyl-ACP methyl ester carboxylesterase